MKLRNNIILFLIIMIAIAITIFPQPLNNLDEIWNFNFAKNIADGRVPYRDFNMLQVPLLHFICAIFLKIFGVELLVMRILGIILCSAILFVTYKILRVLEINKYFSGLSIMAIYFIFYNYFCIDYNYATLLIALIAIYIELRNILKTT
jgi:hypothetical protein